MEREIKLDWGPNDVFDYNGKFDDVLGLRREMLCVPSAYRRAGSSESRLLAAIIDEMLALVKNCNCVRGMQSVVTDTIDGGQTVHHNLVIVTEILKVKPPPDDVLRIENPHTGLAYAKIIRTGSKFEGNTIEGFGDVTLDRFLAVETEGMYLGKWMETLDATVGGEVFPVNQFRSAFHINAQMIGKGLCDMPTCPSEKCIRNRERLVLLTPGEQLRERLHQQAMTPESKAKTKVVVDFLNDPQSGRAKAKKPAPVGEPVVVLHFTHDNIGESGQGGVEGDAQAGAARGGHSGGGGGGGGNGARGTDSAQNFAGDWAVPGDETEDDEDGVDPKGPSRSAAVAKRGLENAATTTEQGGKRLRPAAGGVGAARDQGKSAASDKGVPRAVSTAEAADAMKQLMNTYWAKGDAAMKAPALGAGTSAPLARVSAFGAASVPASVPAASSAQPPFANMLRQSTNTNSLAAGRLQVGQGALSPGVAPTLVNPIQGASGSAGGQRRDSDRRASAAQQRASISGAGPAAQQRASISGAGRLGASLETLQREQEDATLAAPPPARVLSSASSSASASAPAAAAARAAVPAVLRAAVPAVLRAAVPAVLRAAVPAVHSAAPEGMAVAPAVEPLPLTTIVENFLLGVSSFYSDRESGMQSMQDELQVLSTNFQDLESEHRLLQSTSSVAVSALADMTARVSERNAELNRLQTELHQATTALAAAHAAAAAGSSEALIVSQAALSAANTALNSAREETTEAQSEAQAATAAAAAATSACELAQSTLDGMQANMMAIFNGNALFARGHQRGQGGAAGGGLGGAAGGQ